MAHELIVSYGLYKDLNVYVYIYIYLEFALCNKRRNESFSHFRLSLIYRIIQLQWSL